MRPRAATIGEFPAPPAPGSRTPSMPPRSAAVPARDPLDVVIEAIGELDLFDSAQTAAKIACDALALGLGARAVVIHVYDSRVRELRAVAASGQDTAALVGVKTKVDDDVIASTVIENATTMTLKIDPEVGLPRHAPERLRTLATKRAVVAMPALVKKRVVAIIEIFDASERATDVVEPAAEYASTQLARFLESRMKR